MMESGSRKKVISPVEDKEGKTVAWRVLGSAYVNKDKSINVYLDGLPVNGRLQIREYDDRDKRPWGRQGDNNGAHAGIQMPLHAVAPDAESSREDLPF